MLALDQNLKKKRDVLLTLGLELVELEHELGTALLCASRVVCKVVDFNRPFLDCLVHLVSQLHWGWSLDLAYL